MCVKSLFGLLVSIFEGVVGQCGFIACVFHHVVPCDQSLANGCSPWLKTLLEEKGGHKLCLRRQVSAFTIMSKMKLWYK